MSQPHPLDDPQRRRRTVRLLLALTPFMFAGCYLLASAQGARPQDSLLIAAIGAAMCLAAALVIHLTGSKSQTVLTVVRLLVALVARRR